MTKKMLLSAVSNYGGQVLEAAVRELENWRDFLSAPPYNFRVQAALTDAAATKSAITGGLRTLLYNAQPGDQLVWFHAGHGTMFGPSQALIVYPSGGTDPRSDLIQYSDVAEVLGDTKPDPEVDITFIIESCFAEGFRDEDDVPLFLSLNLGFDAIAGAVAQGGQERESDRISNLAFVGSRSDEVFADPVILAASRNNQAAYQTSVANQKRMRFSYRALEHLALGETSFNDLVRSINPLRKKPLQEAAVYGSERRKAETFPGQPPQRAELGTSEANFASERRALAATAVTPSSIEMRFIGFGCFIPPKVKTEGFQNRIVLPSDSYVPNPNDPMHHFAFLEVAEEDLYRVTGDYLFEKSYQRGGVCYKRWRLVEHTVTRERGYVAAVLPLAGVRNSRTFDASALS